MRLPDPEYQAHKKDRELGSNAGEGREKDCYALQIAAARTAIDKITDYAAELA
ncbi:MAG: hypothetical protein HXY20_13835 [Acidobacteria bacterium]|nr:hypothetical protein [Acidobacteriota bacterium]